MEYLEFGECFGSPPYHLRGGLRVPVFAAIATSCVAANLLVDLSTNELRGMSDGIGSVTWTALKFALSVLADESASQAQRRFPVEAPQ